MLALNWGLHMQHLGLDNYLVYCMDKPTYQCLKKENINCQIFSTDGNKEERNEPSRSIAFKNKLLIWNKVINLHEKIIFSDVDAVWIKNPLPVVADGLNDCDFLFSKGDRHPPDIWKRYGVTLCTGWFAMRNTEPVRRILAKAFDIGIEKKMHYVGDQAIMNHIIFESLPSLQQLTGDNNGEYSFIAENANIKILRDDIIGISDIIRINKHDGEHHVIHFAKKAHLFKNGWIIPTTMMLRHFPYHIILLRVLFVAHLLNRRFWDEIWDPIAMRLPASIKNPIKRLRLLKRWR